MTKKQKAAWFVGELKKVYPEALCSLESKTPFELLVATRLSAQCTDKRVNEVTPALFLKYRSPDDFASADLTELERFVYPCGFYHTKAKDIIKMAAMVRDVYGGILPDTVEELTKLPGVGRKTANLIVGDVYGKPAVVCDTHLIRISNRLGLVDTKVPEKVEMQLKKILPPEESNDFCHRIVLFGRDTCTARKANCERCPLRLHCSYGKEGLTYGEN